MKENFMNFVLKKKKIKNSKFKISYDMLKKVANLSNLTLVHFPGGQNLPHFLTSYTAQAGWNLPYFELKTPKSLEWWEIEKSDKNKSYWKLNFIAF